MYTPCCSLLYLVKGGSAGKGLQEAWSHYGGTPGEEPVVSWFLRAASIHSWDRPAGILIPFPHKKTQQWRESPTSDQRWLQRKQPPLPWIVCFALGSSQSIYPTRKHGGVCRSWACLVGAQCCSIPLTQTCDGWGHTAPVSPGTCWQGRTLCQRCWLP